MTTTKKKMIISTCVWRARKLYYYYYNISSRKRTCIKYTPTIIYIINIIATQVQRSIYTGLMTYKSKTKFREKKFKSQVAYSLRLYCTFQRVYNIISFITLQLNRCYNYYYIVFFRCCYEPEILYTTEWKQYDLWTIFFSFKCSFVKKITQIRIHQIVYIIIHGKYILNEFSAFLKTK